MRSTRVIPVLLLKGQDFVKTTKFKSPVYLGEPANILRIFNDKEVDEIVILDIDATPSASSPQFDFLAGLVDECFMPLGVGGGIQSLAHARRVLEVGAEKCIFNSAAVADPSLIGRAAAEFGSQSVVVCIDTRRRRGGLELRVGGGRKVKRRTDPVEWAKQAADLGAGELIVSSIDRDGTRDGFDIDTISQVASAVDVPVVALGGAGEIADFELAVDAGAAAVAAGSMFVFAGSRNAVLINTPPSSALDAALP